MLSIEQRWLLMHMGSWQIVHALCSPEGVTKLMQSCWGSSGGRSHADSITETPPWVKGCGWEISGGAIHSRGQGGPHVRIKAAEIKNFASRLPADIKAELIECRDAGTANAVEGYHFCHCGTGKKRDHFDEHFICPPTEDQERAHRDEYWRILDWQIQILAKALGLGGQSWIDGEQLDLFEAAS